MINIYSFLCDFPCRIVQNGKETVEVKTDGKVTFKSIDGVEQDLPKLKSKWINSSVIVVVLVNRTILMFAYDVIDSNASLMVKIYSR